MIKIKTALFSLLDFQDWSYWNKISSNVFYLKIFFNPRGRVKVDIALAKGRKLHDKRENTKEREWNREIGRLLRDRG